MSDKRWTILVCPSCSTITDYDRPTGCGACEDGPMTTRVVVMPVAPVIPITTLREWVADTQREADPEYPDSFDVGVMDTLASLTRLLDAHEGTTT